MRLGPGFLFALAAGLACGCSGAPPEIHALEDQVVAVGEEVVVVIHASDRDGDELTYSFSSDAPGIHRRAEISRLPIGAGEFRWTPLSEDVGEWFFDFHVSDGAHTTTSTIRIDVRSAVGANSSPRFLRPQGMGTSLNLDRDDCFELDVEVNDSDSASVEFVQEEPKIEGASLQKTGDLSAIWRWCPNEQQIAADDRHTLMLSAGDGDNPKTTHPYLLVLRKPQKPDCPGEAPVIQHQAQDESTLVGLTAAATISDDQGLKREPLLYYSTTEPTEPLDLGPDGPFTQLTMLLVEGDMRSGTWAADVPNPVADQPAGSSADLWYVILAQDDDDTGGNCDHVTQSQAPQVTVTNPGGSGGAPLCEPCTTDLQCGGADDLCVRVGTGSASFCLRECSGAADCPEHYTCSPDPVASVHGVAARQCVPISNDCLNPSGEMCEDDSFEENDSHYDAYFKPLLPQGEHQARSCPGPIGFGDDEDWYDLEVAEEATVELTLSGGTASDLDLGLFDQSGAELGYSESFSSQESVTLCLSPGYYTARVYAWGVAENAYTLTHHQTEGTCGPTCEADENEDDDGPTQAREVDAFPDPYTSTTQSICAGDRDYYAVDLFDLERLVADLTFTHADGDLDLYLYDSDGGTNLTPCCTANGQSSSDDERLEYTVIGDGTYYLVVEGYAGAENLYDLSISILPP